MPDPYVEPLYEDDSTGMLQVGDDGKAFRMSGAEDGGRASLSGPIKRYGYKGQQGLGGTYVDGSVPEPTKLAQQGLQQPPRQLTPEELMAWAIQTENETLEATRASAGSTAVDPALIRTGYYGNPDGVPDFLRAYMDTQTANENRPDPYGPEKPPSTIDNIVRNKYLSEQEKLKYIEFVRNNSRSEGTR